MEEFVGAVLAILAAAAIFIFGFGGGLDHTKKIYGKQHCVSECGGSTYEVKIDDKFICLCPSR